MAGDLMESRRCTAKSKQSGEQCRRFAVVGGTVCATHGGSAPQVRAAAQQRQLEAAAAAEVKKLWVGLDQAPAVADPVLSLGRLAGALEQAVDVVGARVNSLGDHLAAGQGMAQMRGEIVLLERLLGQLRQALEGMARLGIEERKVELAQGQAELVTTAFRAGLAVLSLLPADRDLALRTFLSELGRGPEQLEGGAA